MQNTPIVYVSDVEKILSEIPVARIQQGRKYYRDKNGEKIYYLDVITSFDIETSHDDISDTSEEDWQAWLYLWAFQIGDIATVTGRTWEEFFALQYIINQFLDRMDGVRLLCYVHDLSHEFQYLAGIFDFDTEDVLVMKERVPLVCYLNHIEFRCSLKLADYKLEDWCRKMQTDHQKITGYDYNMIRYPWTPLTSDEIQYCINDVICVVECVEKMKEMYNDTIYTIPYTSTGYIRRIIKANMIYWSRMGIRDIQNTFQHYKYLRQAFRGGDSYEALQYHGTILDDIDIYDISSSYPAIAVHCCLPMSQFRDEKCSIDTVKMCLNEKRCFVARMGFHKIHLKPEFYMFPYIVYASCTKDCETPPRDCSIDDNGRLYAADYIELAITDVDFEIIYQLYDWDGDPDIKWIISARYGYIPQPLADIIINLYKKKTLLKGVKGKESEYDHTKRQLNAGCFGIMAQKLTNKPIEWRNNQWLPKRDYNEEEDYEKSINKAFTSYAWAVFITAIGRKRFIQGCIEALKLSEDAFVYGDTDSVVSRLPIDFTAYNQERIREAKQSGAYAYDQNGDIHYIGVFEHKGRGLFRTVGIKQYLTRINGVTSISVAGVPKEKGSQIIDRDGIESFDIGYVFKGSGKTIGRYNDDSDFYIEREGHTLHITRNVAILEADYTLSDDCMEYEQIMTFLQKVDEEQ